MLSVHLFCEEKLAARVQIPRISATQFDDAMAASRSGPRVERMSKAHSGIRNRTKIPGEDSTTTFSWMRRRAYCAYGRACQDWWYILPGPVVFSCSTVGNEATSARRLKVLSYKVGMTAELYDTLCQCVQIQNRRRHPLAAGNTLGHGTKGSYLAHSGLGSCGCTRRIPLPC